MRLLSILYYVSKKSKLAISPKKQTLPAGFFNGILFIFAKEMSFWMDAMTLDIAEQVKLLKRGTVEVFREDELAGVCRGGQTGRAFGSNSV